jgi:hypothetical protein
MATFFAFEQDFIDSLRCIPMVVRYKLDTCGVKLKLNHWHNFSSEEKEFLVNKPCQTSAQIEEYRSHLQGLIHSKTGEYAKELTIDPHPPWLNKEEIPNTVQEKAKEFDFQITLSQWQNLDDIQRFVLIKLSNPGHENRNFLPALKEFNVVS